MPTITILPTQSYEDGTIGPAEANLSSGLSQGTLEVDITEMTEPTQFYEAVFDLSLDGGVTWASQNPHPQYGLFPVKVTRFGTVSHDRNGNVLTLQKTGPVAIPGVGTSNRRLSGKITISGGPYVLGAQVTVN